MIQVHEFFPSSSLGAVLLIDGVTFIVFGTLWIYLIGLLLAKLVDRLRRRKNHEESLILK